MNRKEKMTVGILALCLLLGLAVASMALTGRTRALRFVNSMGAGLNLGNTLDATGLREYEPEADDLAFETSWGNPKIDAETFRTIKAAGFDTVRIPVTWEDHLDESYHISDVWMNRVQEVVDMALAEELYVILDVHHDKWLNLELEHESQIREELVSVWGQIAGRFQRYGEKLLFEGMNEPRLRDSEYEWTVGSAELQAMVNRLNAAFVETVRASGRLNKKRYLLICPYANRHETEALQALEIPKDGRLIVSVHMYTPHSFCQEEDGDREWDTGHTKERISTTLQEMDTLFVAQKIPVILTEFGSIDKDNTEARIALAKHYREESRRCGIVCIWWDASEYAILDRESKTWKFPEIVEVLTQDG